MQPTSHAGKIPQIQGALFADQHLQTLAFRHQGEKITSSLTGTGIPLAIFRYVDQPAQPLGGQRLVWYEF